MVPRKAFIFLFGRKERKTERGGGEGRYIILLHSSTVTRRDVTPRR